MASNAKHKTTSHTENNTKFIIEGDCLFGNEINSLLLNFNQKTSVDEIEINWIKTKISFKILFICQYNFISNQFWVKRERWKWSFWIVKIIINIILILNMQILCFLLLSRLTLSRENCISSKWKLKSLLKWKND